MFPYEFALVAIWLALTLRLIHDSPHRHDPVGREG